ncbi:hypothetical protein AKJ09_09192 [Labilithrix luteola]|uniref:Tetratricopeptide repeat protein n=1 Tax=Labilithrix luteola TaxID=1391654 RepID=A0A0K1Q9W1_9BACT|nr:hypothetical protein [Labilithrix luteola]AKV02529.1 hypothetical protein AKJ09_09192 [Labilithrix luteola]
MNRRLHPFLLAVAGIALGGLVSSSALAQDKEADAERLFREGQKLLEERRYGEACPKFEAAYKKDGQLGTLLNLAFCHKEQGAAWYAWLEFREAELKAAELGRNDRRDFAHQHVVELEKQLPKVIVDNPRAMPLTEVLVEERRVPGAEKGTVFAAEAGQRKLTFRATGKKQATAMVTLTKGDRPHHVAVPEMEEAPPEAEPVKPTPAAESASEPAQTPSESAHPSGSQRTLGFVALGVGGAALVAGAVTGVMTLSSACAGTSDGCTTSAKDTADTTAMISNVSFAVAGVGIVSGLVLLLTAPSTTTPASDASHAKIEPRFGAGWAGLAGTF